MAKRLRQKHKKSKLLKVGDQVYWSNMFSKEALRGTRANKFLIDQISKNCNGKIQILLIAINRERNEVIGTTGTESFNISKTLDGSPLTDKDFHV